MPPPPDSETLIDYAADDRGWHGAETSLESLESQPMASMHGISKKRSLRK